MAVRDDFAPGEVLAAADLNDTFASKLDLAGGKILQIVRATDSTSRSTTSTSYVDASLSVTITPEKADSAIICLYSAAIRAPDDEYTDVTITDSSNNSLSGAELARNGARGSTTQGNFSIVVIGYSTPATTSATTYKVRFKASSGTAQIFNATHTGQLYAIEVSA